MTAELAPILLRSSRQRSGASVSDLN
jgi:hypothetical protein